MTTNPPTEPREIESKLKNTNKEESMNNYASVVKHLSFNLGDDAKAAKAGYDLLMGVQRGDVEARYKAWKRYFTELQTTHIHTNENRDGVWVPAIEEDSL